MSLDAIGPETWALLTTYGTRVLGVIALFIIARMVAGWAARAVGSGLNRAKFDKTLTRFFSKGTRFLILTAAVVAILGVFGIETTSFAAIIGAAGLAVGLAFQGTLSNFSAGVMLLVFRPFEVGDVVSVSGVTGKVHAVDLFTTAFDTVDNRRIVVPNSSIAGSTIENITHHDLRRVDVNVGADYGADIDETRKVLEAAAASVPTNTGEPGPQVFLKSLGGLSVDWQVRVWCKTADYFACWEQTTRAIKYGMDEAGIGIPYNTVDVNLDADAIRAALGKAA